MQSQHGAQIYQSSISLDIDFYDEERSMKDQTETGWGRSRCFITLTVMWIAHCGS